MTEEIPQWAKERACELVNAECGKDDFWEPDDADDIATVRSLARYIAKHEQLSVDPDLVKAREICARVVREHEREGFESKYLAGDYDDDPEVQFALAALKETRNGN